MVKFFEGASAIPLDDRARNSPLNPQRIRSCSRASTAVSSNIALSDWGRYLGDATLTAAILDRLAMHALRIDIDGPSYRQHVAHERAAGRGTQRTERAPRRDADEA